MQRKQAEHKQQQQITLSRGEKPKTMARSKQENQTLYRMVINHKDNLALPQKTNTLWQHRDFLLVWAGQTISLCGSQVTTLAFPLTAILVLKASAVQMGFLQAAQFAPFLLVGLFVGVWVDRFRRRPIMIVADLGRFVLLSFIPLAAFFHFLNINEMYLIAFLAGILTIFFDVAYRSYLPSLIDRNKLMDGNSKLELTSSMAQLAGPGLGGMLVQFFTAPISLLVDAFSFAVSALSLGMVRTSEPPVARAAEKPKMMKEIAQGLKVLLGNPILGPLVWSSINVTLFANIFSVVYILYAIYTLHLSPVLLGLIYAVAGVGAIPGAMINQWVTNRFGLGLTLMLTLFINGCAALLVPLAAGSQPVVVTILIASQVATGLATVIWNIDQLSVRQTLTPDALLGRVNGSYRFLVWGAIPIGSLIGGVLGTVLGLHLTLFIGAIGTIVAPAWLLFSPVRKLKTLSEAPVEIQR
jgi:MFS family permease